MVCKKCKEELGMSYKYFKIMLEGDIKIDGLNNKMNEMVLDKIRRWSE